MKRFLYHLYSRIYGYSAVFINVPSERILEWSTKNIPEDILVNNDNANGRETEIHVTALYGLHSPYSDSIKEIISDIKPFVLDFGMVSKFETTTHDVIKIEVMSNELRKLNKLLKTLPHTSKFDEYNPHCTLAYVKKGSCDHLLENFYFDDLEVPVNSLVYSSCGKDKTILNII
jgi:hypothetical protein